MTKQEEINDAFTDLIHHDVYCPVCSKASAHGPNWQEHMCPVGGALYYKLTLAEKGV